MSAKLLRVTSAPASSTAPYTAPNAPGLACAYGRLLGMPVCGGSRRSLGISSPGPYLGQCSRRQIHYHIVVRRTTPHLGASCPSAGHPPPPLVVPGTGTGARWPAGSRLPVRLRSGYAAARDRPAWLRPPARARGSRRPLRRRWSPPRPHSPPPPGDAEGPPAARAPLQHCAPLPLGWPPPWRCTSTPPAAAGLGHRPNTP